MIGNREIRARERERSFILFSMALAVAAFTWNELGRRLAEISRDTAKRREAEELRFGNIENAQRENAAKAAGAQEAAQAAREQREEGWRPTEHKLAVAVTVATVLTLILYAVVYRHAFG